MSIKLTPVVYRVDHRYNPYLYYIKRFNKFGTLKWFVYSGTESIPDFFSIYPDFKYGFDTPEQAAAQLTVYLEATTKQQIPDKV